MSSTETLVFLGREQARSVQAGDWLEPDRRWNETERKRKLTSPTQVLEVRYGCGCQTGVLLRVGFTNGAQSWLDAAWFHEPTAVQQALF